MLTIGPISSLDYYLDQADDYYLKAQEPQGVWAGKGSYLLELDGLIQETEFKNVMKGIAPSGKHSLCKNSGKNHTQGWDLTFSAPKSVSLSWARAEHGLKNDIQSAHLTAVKKALAFLEKKAAITRRGHNGLKKEATIGLVAALFEHATSRDLDPQLHTHCLIANSAPRKDGTWGGIESRNLYQWQMAAGAVYRAELASSIKSIGFGVIQDKTAFQVRGISSHLCEHFSKRKRAITKVLKQFGISNSASKAGDIAALSTRETKEQISREELLEGWSKEFDQLGFTQSVLDKCLIDKGIEDCWNENYLALESINFESILTEKFSTFREQDVYKLYAEVSQWTEINADTAISMANKFIEEDHIVSLGRDVNNNRLYTSTYMIEVERSLINRAKSMNQKFEFTLSGNTVEQALIHEDFSMSDEQKEGILRACQNNHIAVIQGSAGAGKTLSMQRVRYAYEKEGYSVLGAALAKSAAKNLALEAGMPSMTVAKLLKDIEHGKNHLTNQTVLIVDEAGQLGTKQLNELLSVVDAASSKLILVGEDKQLDAIEHSGCLKYLSRSDVIGSTRLQTIRRQRAEWDRIAVTNFRDGKSYDALKEYQIRKQLNIFENSEKLIDALVENWYSYQSNYPDKDTLLLARKWKDVKALNDAVRAKLQSEGLLPMKEVSVKCYVSNREIECKFAVGDRVKFTRNDYRVGFTNGDIGTVTSYNIINGNLELNIELDTGKRVTVSQKEYSDDQGRLYLANAYAITVYSSQGITVDGDVFLYYTSSMDRPHTYVACSRHKDRCHMYVNRSEYSSIQPSSTDDLLRGIASSMDYESRGQLAIEYLEKSKNVTPLSKLKEEKEYVLAF